MPKKEKPTIAYEPVQKMASNLQDSGLTYDGRVTPLSYEDATEKIRESGKTPIEEVLREKIHRVKAGLEEKRFETKKAQKKETAKKVAAYSEDANKEKYEAQMRVTTLQNEYGMLRQRHEFKVHQAKDMMQSRALSAEEKDEIAQHKKEIRLLESKIAGLEEKKSKKKKIAQQEAVEKALAPLRAQLAKKGLVAEQLLKKGDFAKAERELLLNIKQELYDIEDRLAQIDNEIKIESTNMLGVHKLANKETPRFVADLYSEHTQTTTVNKESLNDAGEKLSFTTKTGEQRTATKVNKEGKEVSLAQKSEARLNFETQLKEVGVLQEKYEEAYKKHFEGLSSKKLRQNAILESLGIRKADHARALKQERTAYEQAKASLTENLKRDLVEGRGFAMDQAERVAKKYIEKVLTIENIKQEEKKVATLRTELVDTRLADEAKQKAEVYETAKGLKKFGLWMEKNKLRIGGKVISGSIAIASGLGAGAWALRAVAGMVGGRLGAKGGKILGEKLGKKFFNSDAGSKKVEKISNNYLEGKISITDYQKKLEALGLNANKVTALLSIAGGAGGAMLGTMLEGVGYNQIQPVFADAQKSIHDAVAGVQKLQGLVHNDSGLSQEEWEILQLMEKSKHADEGLPSDVVEKIHADIQQANNPDIVTPAHESALDDTSGASTINHTTNESEPVTPESGQAETVVTTSGSTEATVPEVEHVSAGKIIEVSAVKNDGYIKLAEHMQEKLRAQYPDIDTAPQPVQDFLHKTPEQFSIEEKTLVYTDGKASSGIVHPGYKLTLDPDTGRIEILDKDGSVVSVLEDGNTTTDEVYMGAMSEPKEPEAISVEPHESSEINTNSGETIIPTQSQETPSTNPEVTIERDELGNVVTAENPGADVDAGGTQQNSTTTNPTTRYDANDILPGASSGHTLEVDTVGYDKSVIAIAEQYVGDLSPEDQQAFLDVYTQEVNTIFGYDTMGNKLPNGFDTPSTWQITQSKTLNDFNASYDQMILKGETVNISSQRLHDFLYVKNDFSALQSITNPPVNFSIRDALALTALKAME